MKNSHLFFTIWGSKDEDDNVANEIKEIFIKPFNPSIDTDEDSGDKIDKLMLNNLTGSHLQAGAK